MFIQPINFENNKNPVSLSFKRKIPSSPEFIKIVQELKAIPDLHCACCGMPLIANNKVGISYISFQLPAIEVLQKRPIAAYKGTEAYKKAIEIAKRNPKLPLARTIIWAEKDGDLAGLKPPVLETLKEIVAKTTRFTVPSGKTIYKLRPFKEFYGSPQREIFPVLEKYAAEYPDLTFNEIFRIPRILDYHVQKARETDLMNIKTRQKIFGEVKEMVEKYSPEDIDLFMEYHGQVEAMLNKSSRVPELREYKIRTIYEEFLERASNKIPRDEFLNRIEELDVMGYDIDHFVVDNAQLFHDKHLIGFFLKNRTATIEHCIPLSAKGEDSRDNIIVMCGKCNHDRYSYPYEENLKVHPEMRENVQNQIDTVINAIKNGLLKGWGDYPLGIAKRLKTASNSQIRVNVDDYVEFRSAQINEEIQKQRQILAQKPNYEGKLNKFFNTCDQLTEKHEGIIEKLREIRAVLMCDYLKLQKTNTAQAQEKLEDILEINNSMHRQEDFLEQIRTLSGKLKAEQKENNGELFNAYKEIGSLKKQLNTFLADAENLKAES